MTAKQLCATGDKACKAELKRRGRDSSGKKIGSKPKSVKRKAKKSVKRSETPAWERRMAAADAEDLAWTETLRTKDGVVLKVWDYTSLGLKSFGYHQLRPYDYANEPPGYTLAPLGGGKYKLTWSEEDRSEEEEFWEDWEEHASDYIPDMVERTVLKSATGAQIRKKITGTNRPRIIKYQPSKEK
jgi:hypothetical protein